MSTRPFAASGHDLDLGSEPWITKMVVSQIPNCLHSDVLLLHDFLLSSLPFKATKTQTMLVNIMVQIQIATAILTLILAVATPALATPVGVEVTWNSAISFSQSILMFISQSCSWFSISISLPSLSTSICTAWDGMFHLKPVLHCTTYVSSFCGTPFSFTVCLKYNTEHEWNYAPALNDSSTIVILGRKYFGTRELRSSFRLFADARNKH